MRRIPSHARARQAASVSTLSALTAAALLCGCTASKVPTSTGLPYWPPGETPITGASFNRGPGPGEGFRERREVRASQWREAATPWIGTPYQAGGHSHRGMDCSGFTDQMYREVTGRGIAATAMGQWLEGKAVDLGNARPGDLVFFTTTSERVSHVGVFLGGDQFAHASTSEGVRFSSLNEPYWHDRFIGVRRMSN